MKKQRPGLLIGIICPPDCVESISACLFLETTAIGVRTQHMSRMKLSRKIVAWDSPFGKLMYKVAYSGNQIYGIYPEYESLKACAIENQIPIKMLYTLKPELDLKDII